MMATMVEAARTRSGGSGGAGGSKAPARGGARGGAGGSGAPAAAAKPTAAVAGPDGKLRCGPGSQLGGNSALKGTRAAPLREREALRL